MSLRRQLDPGDSSPSPLSRSNRFDQDPKETVESRTITPWNIGIILVIAALLFVGLVLLDGPEQPDDASTTTTTEPSTVTFPLDTTVGSGGGFPGEASRDPDRDDVAGAVTATDSASASDVVVRPLPPTLELRRELGEGTMYLLTDRSTLIAVDLATGETNEREISSGTSSLIGLPPGSELHATENYVVLEASPTVLWNRVEPIGVTTFPPSSFTDFGATSDGYVWATSRSSRASRLAVYPPAPGENLTNRGLPEFSNAARIVGMSTLVAVFESAGTLSAVELDGDGAGTERVVAQGLGVAFDGETLVRLVCGGLQSCELVAGPLDDPDRWRVELPDELNRGGSVDWARNGALDQTGTRLAIDVDIGAGRTVAVIDLPTGEIEYNISRMTDSHGVGRFAWGPTGEWIIFPLDGDLLVWEPFVEGRSATFRIRLSRGVVDLGVAPPSSDDGEDDE